MSSSETLSRAAEPFIGKPIPRLELPRLLRGGGRYLDDIALAGMLHLCFVRSPHAHAKVRSLSIAAAQACPGVEAVITGADLKDVCKPLHGVARHRPGHKSGLQYAMATDRVFWQGQPVAAVVAESRAEAEDAAELVEIEWEDLTVLADAEAALATTDAMHPELGDNVAFDFTIDKGDSARAFADAALVVEQSFRFERQTGLTLETRGLIAAYDGTDGTLAVIHSHQSPFQMQDIFSQHLGIPEHKVRVTAPDVGGGFGLKLNVYAEEIAVAAISRILERPVKFSADRLESFLSDAHARDHRIVARLAVNGDGIITAMELDDVSAVGAYGMPMRFNVAEGMMAITCSGAPYAFENYKARTRSVYVHKNLIGMYRGVGMPLACAVTEVLTDRAATELGIDPVEFKYRNYRPKASLPCRTPGGVDLETVSFHECLDKLVVAMDYERLRKEQADLRQRGIYRGIGIGTFIEQTAYGPPYYGPSEARISVQDGCTIRLEPSGSFRCITSITDQGQGTLTGIAQIVAETLGVSLDQVGMMAGDSAISPYGGGAWASRGMAIGGEAALKAAEALRANILGLAGTITQTPADRLDIVDGQVVNKQTGLSVISLAEVGKIGYFRQDTLPRDSDVQLSVTRSHVPNHQICYLANGVQASYLELDPATGFISLLGHWAVDDCGKIINPLLVDEQVRGGIVQGIGAVLYEECIYSSEGGLLNGSLAEYLVPMSADVPDIHVQHVETPETSTRLGAKGIGEAGLIGAVGALWVAVNDAMKPFGARISHQPFTPERVLDALRAASSDQG